MRDNFKRVLPVVAILILAAILYGVYSIFQRSLQSSGLVVVSGTIEANEIHLGVPTGGIVDDVFVKEGDTIVIGMTLMCLGESCSDRVLSFLDSVEPRREFGDTNTFAQKDKTVSPSKT